MVVWVGSQLAVQLPLCDDVGGRDKVLDGLAGLLVTAIGHYRSKNAALKFVMHKVFVEKGWVSRWVALEEPKWVGFEPVRRQRCVSAIVECLVRVGWEAPVVRNNARLSSVEGYIHGLCQ